MNCKICDGTGQVGCAPEFLEPCDCQKPAASVDRSMLAVVKAARSLLKKSNDLMAEASAILLARRLREEFTKKYGPLTIRFPGRQMFKKLAEQEILADAFVCRPPLTVPRAPRAPEAHNE